MATLRKEVDFDLPAATVWGAVRDAGAVHRRLCPGVLTDARLDGDARVVTFANGMVVRELLVTTDDAAMRFVWSATGGRLSHHNASMQVSATATGGCRLVWIADLLPDALAPDIDGLMNAGVAAMRRALA